jgi:hypothetical protein
VLMRPLTVVMRSAIRRSTTPLVTLRMAYRTINPRARGAGSTGLWSRTHRANCVVTQEVDLCRILVNHAKSASAVVGSVFGPVNAIPFTATDVRDPRRTRPFASLADIAEDHENVRVWGGVHCRFATRADEPRSGDRAPGLTSLQEGRLRFRRVECLHALLHLLRGDVLLPRGHPPQMPERVLELT